METAVCACVRVVCEKKAGREDVRSRARWNGAGLGVEEGGSRSFFCVVVVAGEVSM